MSSQLVMMALWWFWTKWKSQETLEQFYAQLKPLVAAGVILSDPAVDFFNPNVVRSSRGLFGGMPVALGTKGDVREWLKNSARHIVGTSSRAQEIMGNKKFPRVQRFFLEVKKLGLVSFGKTRLINGLRSGFRGRPVR